MIDEFRKKELEEMTLRVLRGDGPFEPSRDIDSVMGSIKEKPTRFDKAEKVTEWNGWVYWEDAPDGIYGYTSDGGSEGFFGSAGDMLEAIAEYNEDCEDEEDRVAPPKWVWTCEESRYPHRDAEDLFAEDFEEHTHEDGWDYVPKEAIAKLNEALEEFYKATDAIVGYFPNYKKVLIIGEKNEAI